ncbi:hypothetical protein FB565_007569 [Actinoplanes lutulentus]|uniref:Uncharacterized protein n=1 Tax=Actinoplanes lutulentus TaxID=1287878 RepID=A0A327ZBS1_9ACTN|nr:hypothetical protein [Actinoplanes lutulentus]RAK29888.1 hypothetical protein B0I29_117214 [Actinoplanes lutulentus]
MLPTNPTSGNHLHRRLLPEVAPQLTHSRSGLAVTG